MEQLDYNVLFRWSVRLDVDYPVWDVAAFIKYCDRLLDTTSPLGPSRRFWPAPS